MQASPVALLYPGDREMRDRSDPSESRFADLYQALAAAGIPAAPAVYHDDFADEVEEQLRSVRLVLVWCNPIEGGRRRNRLDSVLRRLTARGVIVSAHPDAVQKLGTKDVLFESRHLAFGSDVHRVDGLDQLDSDLPGRLALGPRVLKQHRGQSGNGVWRIEAVDANSPWTALRVRHAQRGSGEQIMTPNELRDTLAPYFEPSNGGHMIDQAWQPRLGEGMVRAYLVGRRVAGFGCQAINALIQVAAGQEPPLPGPRLYHDADLPPYQDLRKRLESEWVEQLASCVGLPADQLPLLWDCDFLLGESAPGAGQRYVLCEINVSSVSPFPPSAIPLIVAAVRSRLAGPGTNGQLHFQPDF